MNHELKNSIKEQLGKSRSYFEYSYKKVQKMNLEAANDNESLETLESFASRFSRYTDILIKKYFRFLAKEQDPAFKGTVRDLLNLAEKLGWIQSTQTWLEIRELRNLSAHEYSLSSYIEIYKKIFEFAPVILMIDIDL